MCAWCVILMIFVYMHGRCSNICACAQVWSRIAVAIWQCTSLVPNCCCDLAPTMWQAEGGEERGGEQLLARLLQRTRSRQPAHIQGGCMGLAALPAALLCQGMPDAITALGEAIHKASTHN